jgi:hypothetical protein
MRTFGGHAPVRNAAFQVALTNIGNATGHQYWAAGFTEVLNDSAALNVELSAIAQTLDPGLTSLVLIEVGITAVGARSEFVGIAWDPAAFDVDGAGHVLHVDGAWQAENTNMAGVANATIGLPMLDADLKADARGLAYVAGTHGGAPYLLGFMHNMYGLGDRYGGFANLWLMAGRARQAAGAAYAAAEIVIGGDFNIEPRDPRLHADPYLAHRGARGPAPAGGVGPFVNTTNAHPYDFWLVSDVAIPDANASVHVDSRTADCSDHAGISLVI